MPRRNSFYNMHNGCHQTLVTFDCSEVRGTSLFDESRTYAIPSNLYAKHRKQINDLVFTELPDRKTQTMELIDTLCKKDERVILSSPGGKNMPAITRTNKHTGHMVETYVNAGGRIVRQTATKPKNIIDPMIGKLQTQPYRETFFNIFGGPGRNDSGAHIILRQKNNSNDVTQILDTDKKPISLRAYKKREEEKRQALCKEHRTTPTPGSRHDPHRKKLRLGVAL